MKRIATVLVLVVLAFIAVGCKSTVPYFYSDNSAKNFDILGEVTFVGTLVHKGYYPVGSASFQELLNAAKEKYKNADYVVNVTIDYTREWGLFGTRYTYSMRGMAVKYK